MTLKGCFMKSRIALAVGLLTCLVAVPAAYAHHSFAAEFDGSKPTRLVGKITRVEWTNPHSYFYVEVVDSKGQLTNWGCEGAGPGALSRRGWKKGDLKIGDTIVVDGYRAKDGSHLVDARRVTFPDGRTVYGGSPGDGGPGDNGTDQGAPPAAPAK
jgi:hypothetical protein